MSTSFHPDALTVPVLTTGEVARLARVDAEELAQWQKPNRLLLGGFGEMSASGRRIYSLNDAVFLRIAASLMSATGAGPAEAATAARGALGALATLGARRLPAEPGERLVACHFYDGEAWRWHATTRAWVGRAIAEGAGADAELVLPIEEIRDGVIRAALIYALRPDELDPIAPRGTPSLAARLAAAGLENAELTNKLRREQAGKK